MASVVTSARQLLFRHPSFWAEDEQPEQLLEQVMEDPRVIASEKWVYTAISSQTTPFIASLDENTINVGFCLENGAQKNCFRRIIAHPSGETSGYTWLDRYMAYENLNKLHLGHECVISESEPEGAEQRINKRLIIGRLEATPPLRQLNKSTATTPHTTTHSSIMHNPKSASFASLEGGNSLFEAFSTAVWGSSAYHLHLRQLVVDYMRQEPTTEYAAFLGNDFHKYLDYMSQPGVAGDELVLRALADRFGLPLTVVTGDEVIWCVRYPARDTWSQREVFLAVAPGARFSAVRRQSAITTLKLTFSSGEDAKAARAVIRKHTEAEI
ncbi:hypothetical protein Ndes2437B_g04007 [Nannochloris sp. 'desiccata']|nr:hypothetical protein KSW81_003503 [Chlorella desiccata (nom. nud.)]